MNNFTPALRALLRDAGYEFWRRGKGDHEIWRHSATGRKVTVDSKVKSRHLANKILVQDAGLPKAF